MKNLTKEELAKRIFGASSELRALLARYQRVAGKEDIARIYDLILTPVVGDITDLYEEQPLTLLDE